MAATLRRYPKQVRADFRRFYQVDVLRCGAPEIIALVEDLMTLDSSTARAINGGPVWQIEHYLAADLWSAFTGKPYPNKPKRSAVRAQREHDPQYVAKRDAARARARERARAIAAGEIT